MYATSAGSVLIGEQFNNLVALYSKSATIVEHHWIGKRAPIVSVTVIQADELNGGDAIAGNFNGVYGTVTACKVEQPGAYEGEVRGRC